MRDRQRHLSLRRTPRTSNRTASEGLYNPLNTSRQIFAGAGDSSAIVQMTSWHEMFHAFLNASTCHGNAIIFAGALANAGHAAFLPMVESMIDAALLTHESYATVAAVSAVGRGRIEPGLLADYRDYLPLLEGFMRLFPAKARPLTSLVAFSASARAAMQTDIYDTLRATPVAKWPDIELAAALPDDRFAQLMTTAAVSRVIAAIDAHLSAKNTRLAGGGELLELRYWRAAPAEDLDQMNEAAFAACSAILAEGGQGPCAFDGHQQDLGALIAMVEAYGGENLRTRFHAPASPEAHADALFLDFRSEELVLSRTPLPAGFINSQTHDALDRFVLGAPERRYIQLIVMPEVKARAIYSPIDGQPGAATEDGLLVGLRRRSRPNDGSDAIVEILQLQPNDLAWLHQPEKFDTYVILAMSALSAHTWFGDWLQSPACPFTRMTVMLDEDPFDLLQQHAARGAHLEITYLRAPADGATSAHTEVLAILAADQPNIVYFTPCTSPFRHAVSEYARLRLPGTRFSAEAFARHMAMLQTLSAHVLREEPRFGNRFWLR